MVAAGTFSLPMKAIATRRAFTVIELLVVIAIIMVLMALIFAFMRRGQDAANATRCMNNVRQIAATHVNLARENNGYIVHPYRSAALGSWNRNWAMYHTILVNEDFGWRQPGDEVNARMRTMDHFKCPTAFALKAAEMAEKDNQGGWRTYSLNGRIGTDKEPSKSDRGWIDGAMTLTQVQSPAKLVLVMERYWNGNQYPAGGGPWPGEYGYADFHGGRSHFGFMDGHVEKLRPEEMLLGGVSFPNGQEGKWNNPEFALMWRGQMFKREIPD